MVRRLCFLALLAAAYAAAQTTVEIDNAWVRVIRVKQGPHGKNPAVEHPASVAVYLTDTRQKVGNRELTHKGGDVAYLEPAKETEENLSDQPLEYILVELKPNAPSAKGWPVKLDPVKLD